MTTVSGNDVTFTSGNLVGAEGGIIVRNGISVDSTDILATAVSVANEYGAAFAVGQSFDFKIVNDSNFVITVTENTGTTLKPDSTSTIQPGTVNEYLIIITSSTTYDCYNLSYNGTPLVVSEIRTTQIVTETSSSTKLLTLEDSGGATNNVINLITPTPLSGSYTLTFPQNDGGNNQVLATDGSGGLSWINSEFFGPLSSTDNALARWDGVVGNTLQNSGIILDDNDNLTGANAVTASGTVTCGTITDGTASLTSGSMTGIVNVTASGFLRGSSFVLEDGPNTITFQSPTLGSGSYVLTFPTDDGIADQVLTTDGNGNLTWETVSTSGGIQSLNGLTVNVQTFATGTTGTDFTINSSGSTHTFNFPNSSTTNRGLLTSLDWTTFNSKLGPTLSSGNLFVGNGSNQAVGVVLSGDATIVSNGVMTIANDAIDSNKLADNAVTTAKIVNGNVTNSKLTNSSLTVIAGNGLSGGGSITLGGSGTLNVNVDNSSLEISSDTLQVKDLGITNAKLAGGITNAKLQNSSITVTAGDGLQNGGSVSLGGSITLNVDSTVVRTSGNQTITGIKTFSDSLYANSLYINNESIVGVRAFFAYCSTTPNVTNTPQAVPFDNSPVNDSGYSLITSGGNAGQITITDVGLYQISYEVVTIPTNSFGGTRGSLFGDVRVDPAGGTSYSVVAGSESAGYMREIQGNQFTSYSCGKTILLNITAGSTMVIGFYRNESVQAELRSNYTSVTLLRLRP